MNAHLRNACILLALLLTPLASAPAQTAPAASKASPATRMEEHTFQSKALAREMPYRVVLPAGYDTSERRYPVLYLLHGWHGNDTNWTMLTNLIQDAEPYPMIIVTPEGENSWYVNSATTPADRFEDYIATDLIAEVEHHYRAIASSHRRAIAGLSMGGYGALLLSLKHPDTFAVVGSLSGAFDGPIGIESVMPSLKVSTDAAYGAPGSHTRSDNDVFPRIDAAGVESLPYLFIACGSQDPLLPASRRVAASLSAKKVAYEYHEYPDAHTWAFWDASLPALLRVVAQRIADQPAAN
jgi:putative tributyrin esterase